MGSLQIALYLLQVVPGLILDAEKLYVDRKGSGPEKKAWVLDAIRRGLDVAQHFGVKALAEPGVKDQALGAAGEITDAVVGGLNAAGVLKAAAPPK